VIQAAYQYGLSTMWIAYLQSLSTQDVRPGGIPATQDRKQP
jgi:hypothetical protein